MGITHFTGRQCALGEARSRFPRLGRDPYVFGRAMSQRIVLTGMLALSLATAGCTQKEKIMEDTFRQAVESSLRKEGRSAPSGPAASGIPDGFALGDLFPFEWESACFSDGPGLAIRFLGAGGAEQGSVSFSPEEFLVREAFVPGSPVGRCYGRQQKVAFKQISVRYKPVVVLSIIKDGV